MYAKNPAVKVPDDPEIRVWRYMDFTKFVDLLERGSLYFPRLSVLQKGDPFEGALAKANVHDLTIPEPDKDNPEPLGVRLAMLNLHRQLAEEYYVSSWHMNDGESAAMWRLYLKSGEGIAIQSTFRRLCEAFEGTEQEVMIGLVEYIDYVKETIPPRNVLLPSLRKRKSFQHEQEVRAIALKFDHPNPGLLVPVRLDVLVERVYVAPTAPSWLAELIERVIRRYGHAIPVERSELMDRPMY